MSAYKFWAVSAAAALALGGTFTSPAAAQESSYAPGTFMEVSMIDVEDGQGEAYADFLATQWKKNQEFAKSKGWITAYRVLANSFAREGEPDLYLIVEFASLPDADEDMRRQREYEAWVKKNSRQLDVESGGRTKMRTVMGSMLLREMKLR